MPLNSPDALTSIARAAAELGQQAAIGAGTVLTTEHVKAVDEAGGTFIVSPDTNRAVVEETVRRKLLSYPGVFTPSDAFSAIAAGATGLKFFPAEVLAPKGIKAMKAVLPPAMPVYAVGGANPDNFGEYFAAGCTGLKVLVAHTDDRQDRAFAVGFDHWIDPWVEARADERFHAGQR